MFQSVRMNASAGRGFLTSEAQRGSDTHKPKEGGRSRAGFIGDLRHFLCSLRIDLTSDGSMEGQSGEVCRSGNLGLVWESGIFQRSGGLFSENISSVNERSHGRSD